MNAPDLFAELLPANYADHHEVRALAYGIVSDWFGALKYSHNHETHTLILESLCWPGMPDFVRDAALHTQDTPIVFERFAVGVRTIARRARAAGLVVKDGQMRKRWRPGDATGDLFGGDGIGVAK